MKTKLMKVVLMCAVLLGATQFTFAGPKNRGDGAGNGGDAYALEFKAIAQSVCEKYYTFARLINLNVTIEQFCNVVKKVKVQTKEKLTLDGREVDAINYPDTNKIILNGPRWSVRTDNKLRAVALVIHELLGVMRIEDGEYQKSKKVLRVLRPYIVKNPSHELRYACDVIMWNPRRGEDVILFSYRPYSRDGSTHCLHVSSNSLHGFKKIHKKLHEVSVNFQIDPPYFSNEQTKLFISVNRDIHNWRGKHIKSIKLLSRREIKFGWKSMKTTVVKLSAKKEMYISCMRLLDIKPHFGEVYNNNEVSK